ncbi:MAG TPA: outer membrane protein assembly factor BamD [Terriglobales bacterium]|nr:outer membrane protein assembly factor BamD [Terriglobales bacterium]
MSRRTPLIASVAILLVLTAACTNKKVNNPLANVGSKQPDKVLFDRAMEQMKHNRFDQARMILQTLINTYPDSEYIARAKLAVGDSWYAEGGTASLAQAELEYKDFITFFPNMPEAAEAQLKIANIHYQQMEKADRDFTHAMRAEEEYRQLMLQFPDSKLVPEAKQRLLEVQEVLAQREFQIGRFYYLRNSYPAAIARLQSVVERYPLYSGADEALFLLGQCYEGEIANVRNAPMRGSNAQSEAAKARMIQAFTKNAADAYSRILTRYPMMERAEDAKRRLAALHEPVPTPTQAAIVQNRKEEESRRSSGMFGRLMGNFSRHPDVAQATKAGDPTLVDPKPVSATDVVAAANRAVFNTGTAGENKVAVETVKGGTPAANEAAPRSDAAPAAAGPDTGTAPANTTPATTEVETVPASNESAPAPAANGNAGNTGDSNTGIGELKPNVAPDSQTPPPPAQVNELQQNADQQNGQANAASSSSKASATAESGNGSDNSQASNESRNMSSSKKKKKKHFIF